MSELFSQVVMETVSLMGDRGRCSGVTLWPAVCLLDGNSVRQSHRCVSAHQHEPTACTAAAHSSSGLSHYIM